MDYLGIWRRVCTVPTNVRVYLTLAAIIGALALILLVTRFNQPERAKPGSPEYAAYIEHYVHECFRYFERYIGGRKGRQLPSEPERQAACRDFVLQADRLNPVARPLVQRTGHADFPHPALGQDFTPSPAAH